MPLFCFLFRYPTYSFAEANPLSPVKNGKAMFISHTILRSILGATVILFGDLHLPNLKEEEQTQIHHLITMVKETPDSLLLLETGRPLSDKLINLTYPAEAARNSFNFMLLGETKKTLNAQNVPFIDLGEKRPSEDYFSLTMCIYTLAAQLVHFMPEEEAIAKITAELKDLCPAHLSGTVDEWYTYAQTTLTDHSQALKNLNPTNPSHSVTQGQQRLNEAQSLLTAAYQGAQGLKTTANDSFLSLVARSCYNYSKDGQINVNEADQLKWKNGLDSQGILAHRMFIINLLGFSYRTFGIMTDGSYALSEMDLAAFDEVQKTTAKTIFIATGAAHSIVIKDLLKGCGFTEIEETCTLFAQLPNAPFQELKKLPGATNSPELLKITQILSGQCGALPMPGIYELTQEAKEAVGKRLNVFALSQ